MSVFYLFIHFGDYTSEQPSSHQEELFCLVLELTLTSAVSRHFYSERPTDYIFCIQSIYTDKYFLQKQFRLNTLQQGTMAAHQLGIQFSNVLHPYTSFVINNTHCHNEMQKHSKILSTLSTPHINHSK